MDRGMGGLARGEGVGGARALASLALESGGGVRARTMRVGARNTRGRNGARQEFLLLLPTPPRLRTTARNAPNRQAGQRHRRDGAHGALELAAGGGGRAERRPIAAARAGRADSRVRRPCFGCIGAARIEGGLPAGCDPGRVGGAREQRRGLFGVIRRRRTTGGGGGVGSVGGVGRRQWGHEEATWATFQAGVKPMRPHWVEIGDAAGASQRAVCGRTPAVQRAVLAQRAGQADALVQRHLRDVELHGACRCRRNAAVARDHLAVGKAFGGQAFGA